MTRKWTLIIGMVVSFLPLGVWSLGLGDVDLKSYLNQPLNAEIEILTIDQSELKDLKVRLASEAEFRRAGIEYSASLYRLKFKIIRKPNGKAYILILSGTGFKEPYLNLLLVVKWPKGKILREYALLIDPPVKTIGAPIISRQTASAPEEKTPEEKTPAKTEKKSEYVAAKSKSESKQAEASKTTPVAKKPARRTPEKKFEAPFYAGEDEDKKAKTDDPTQPGNQFPRISIDRQVDVNLAGTGDDAKSYRVKRGDTMMAIAKRIRGNRKISLHQTMMAIKRANPNAFVRNNVHLVKAGRKLVIPDGATLAGLSHASAMKDYRADTDIFKQGTSAPVSIAESTPVPKKAEAVKTAKYKGKFDVLPPNENTKVTGDIGSDEKAKDNQGGGSNSGEQAELNKAKAMIDKDHESTKALRTSTEKEFAEQVKTKRVIDIKNDTMENLQRTLAVRNYCKNNKHDRNCFTVAGFKKIKLEDLKNKGKSAASPFKEEAASGGFMDSVKAKYAVWMGYLKQNPMMAALVGGGVLFTLILLFLIIRQIRRSRDDFHESILDFDEEHPGDVPHQAERTQASEAPAQAKATPAAVPQESMVLDSTNEESQSSYLSDFVVSNMDNSANATGESDPLTEADVFYAYGKYEAAEMLIKESMQAEPNRLDLRYKLLDIYHGAKNKEAFEYEASTLHDMLGGQPDPMWDKVVEMGQSLAPGNALFSDGSTPLADIPVATATPVAAEGGQDFDLDFDFDDLESGSSAADDITSSLESELAAIENDMNAESDFASSENVVSFDMGDASELLASTENDLDPYETDSSLMSDVDEVGTKLDLAKAYIDMGDPEGARSILDEVLEEGTDQQKGEAEELMQQMASG